MIGGSRHVSITSLQLPSLRSGQEMFMAPDGTLGPVEYLASEHRLTRAPDGASYKPSAINKHPTPHPRTGKDTDVVSHGHR